MKRYICGVVVLLSILNTVFAQVDNLVGLWEFDNTGNLTQATVGNNLQLVGSHQAIAGPEVGDGAVNIGVGSYYRCTHGIAANGTGGGTPTAVNCYTLLIDFRIPTTDVWHAFFQTSPGNGDDADAFVNGSAHVGVGATGYSETTIDPDQWYRLVISANLGEHYDYYLDGHLIQTGGAQTFNGRFSLSPSNLENVFLLFADNNGEDNTISIAKVALYDRDLTTTEIAGLGGYDDTPAITDLMAMKAYLQSPTSTSIYISWHSSVADESVVEYGTTSALGQQTTGDVHTFDAATKWHTVHLTGLTPATEYYYRCKTDTALSPIYQFQTIPENTESNGHVRFVVYGDSRTDYTMHAEIVDSMRSKLRALYGTDYHNQVDLIVNVGDIVTSGNVLSQYLPEYFYPIASLSGNIPYMVSIGNHEQESPIFYEYMKYADFAGFQGEKYYSFRIGKVLFLFLNSNIQGTSQLNWLTSQLQSAQADPNVQMVFAFQHHPGRSEMWPDGNTAWTQNQIIPLLLQYDKVELLSYGHSHNYERGAGFEGNLRLMLSGGGGAGLDYWGRYSNQTDYPEIHRSFAHYCYTIVDVDIESNSYAAETYSLGGVNRFLDNVLVDSFSRDRNATGPEMPLAISPSGDISGTISLQVSDFSSDASIMSSQFQIATVEGTWETAFLDIARDWENIYATTGSPNWDPLDHNTGIDLTELNLNPYLFQVDHSYKWRVRYRDQNLQWSAWSAEQVFLYRGPSGAEDEPVIPTNYTLYQNYPNPFNGRTVISYDIPEAGTVRLEVYTLSGELVGRLVDASKEPGRYQLVWDGRNVSGQYMATGEYLYTLKSGGFLQTKKMLLLK